MIAVMTVRKNIRALAIVWLTLIPTAALASGEQCVQDVACGVNAFLSALPVVKAPCSFIAGDVQCSDICGKDVRMALQTKCSLIGAGLGENIIAFVAFALGCAAGAAEGSACSGHLNLPLLRYYCVHVQDLVDSVSTAACQL